MHSPWKDATAYSGKRVFNSKHFEGKMFMVCDSLVKPMRVQVGKQRRRNASQGFRSRSHQAPQPRVSPFTAARPEVQSGCNDLLKFTHGQGSAGVQKAARAMEGLAL